MVVELPLLAVAVVASVVV